MHKCFHLILQHNKFNKTLKTNENHLLLYVMQKRRILTLSAFITASNVAIYKVEHFCSTVAIVEGCSWKLEYKVAHCNHYSDQCSWS